jgi:hypothetical protein
MSEPTNAQIAEQEDLRLNAQIDAYYEDRHQPKNHPDPDWLSNPAIFDVIQTHLGEPHWYDDPDEVVDFARWYWVGAHSVRGVVGEILDYFEKPWKFKEEYAGYKAENP